MMPFDEVWLDDGSGSKRCISAAEFLKLGMSERIGHILNKTVEFVHNGKTLVTRDALLALHAIECAEHSAAADA